ncbi:MAG: hypothetical protein EXX96DRAFT_210179 [Benjaminiella poitrasii]|nr:MAG: hypothetical protein EXX96DRAFT_210179 [Benjaminiella poitrasii]
MKYKPLVLLLTLLVSLSTAKQFDHFYRRNTNSYSKTCISSDASCWPAQSEWDKLNKTVHGNLVVVVRPGETCYKDSPHYDPQACKTFKEGYYDDLHRESYIGTMQNSNWEDCEVGDSCPIGMSFVLPIFIPRSVPTCSQGALPNYALNSTSTDDIATVIQFAAKYRIAFNIKNSGHDYFGRSTSPDSITVWTHPLQKKEFHTSFRPEGCTKEIPHNAFFTLGGGVKWFDAYRAAYENNVTLVGGAQPGVSATGGWLQGGGHSILTPTFGLGVDQVVQFKVVLANGKFVTTNACQYPDLFWALRGGGGGTFGVVIEATVKAHPYIEFQTLVVSVSSDVPHVMKDLFIEFARHSERWANEGWGGYLTYTNRSLNFLYGNPRLSAKAAAVSTKPFLDYIQNNKYSHFYNQIQWDAATHHGFYDFLINTMYPKKLKVGIPIHTSSRLIPRELFSTNETIANLIDAILEGLDTIGSPITSPPALQILATTPFRVQDPNRETSVQPAFRNAVWHLVFGESFKQDAPKSLKSAVAKRINKAADPVRRLTPNSGVYFNEADTLEPSWHKSFWGNNYERLVKIKQKYDPNIFFNCWKCIGWSERMWAEDKKYRCYSYS